MNPCHFVRFKAVLRAATRQVSSSKPKIHSKEGLIHWAAKRESEAKLAFESYLSIAAEAPDRAMIEHYLGQME